MFLQLSLKPKFTQLQNNFQGYLHRTKKSQTPVLSEFGIYNFFKKVLL